MDAKQTYYLQIADNALILSHRLSEYCSRAPFLEEDLANTNVALDLIGTAESIYIRLAADQPDACSDDFAFKRPEHEFVNCLLVEQPNTDFAHIMTRQFFMDSFHFYFFSALVHSSDEFLSALALKTLKEVTYHLKRSSEWMIRLGDGTLEAHEKTQRAFSELISYTPELFIPSKADLELKAQGIGPDLEMIRSQWQQKVNEIMYFANLKSPENINSIQGGKQGIHSEYMGHLLAEMQFLPSRYPDATW